MTLIATPATGQRFSGWGGACSGVATACTLTMNAAKSVTATFVADSASPTPGKNCAQKPSLCGYPDETNTGWEHTGVTLTLLVADPYYITVAGTVVDGKDIRGCVFVRAPNVTIRRSKITCDNQPMIKTREPDGQGGMIDLAPGLLIEDVEFDGKGSHTSTAIAVSHYTVRRAKIHNIGSGVRVGTNVLIEDSYIYDIRDAPDSHNGGIPFDGGENNVIRHNTVFMNTTHGHGIAVYHGTQDGKDVVKNVIVENNLIAGGNYTLYCGATTTAPDLTVTGNRFSRVFYPNGGYYGPTANCAGAVRWENNIWDEDLSSVSK